MMATTPQSPSGMNRPSGAASGKDRGKNDTSTSDKLAVKSAVPGIADPRAAAPNTSIDDLQKRLTNTQAVTEETAEFIAANWRRFVGGAFLVVLFVVIFELYGTMKLTRKGEAGELLLAVQDSFDKIASQPEPSGTKTAEEVKKAADARTDSLRALTDNIDVLKKKEGSNFYGMSGELYRISALILAAQYDEARKALQPFNPQRFLEVKAARSAKELENSDLASELAAMLLVRLELSEGKSGFNEVKPLLTGIAYGARMLAAEAVIALARIASNEAEQNDARTVATQLLTVRPEAGEIVRNELQVLGIELD